MNGRNKILIKRYYSRKRIVTKASPSGLYSKSWEIGFIIITIVAK